MHAHIFSTLSFFYFFYFFRAGPNSAHEGGAEQHACANARMLLQCATELKFTCTKPMLIKLTNDKKQRFAYLVLETKDACSADGSSPMVSLYLPFMLTLSTFPLCFSQRVLKLGR